MARAVAGGGLKRTGWKLSSKVVGGALGVVVLIAVLWWVPRYQVAHTPGVAGEKRFESEDEARKTLAQMLGGAVVLLGLYFSAKTFGLSREGQLTDRYTKAIEQLGKSDGGQPNIEVRLGAIYALERIAVDSPRDHWTIMEVLTAYVRQNAPLELERVYKFDELPSTEIQAILTVLGRRRTDEGRERPGRPLDLSRSRLWNADFGGGNFEGTIFSYTGMRGANLASVNLKGAKLWYADLRKASLRSANLQRARCFITDLREAALVRADLGEAELEACRFEGAELDRADLKGAKIAGAKFYDARVLTVAQVKAAVGWEDARYSPGLRAELGLVEPAAEATDGSATTTL